MPLVEPGDRELVALSRPGPAHDPADDHWVGFSGHRVSSGRWGDVAVLGAGGATAPRKQSIVVRPRVNDGQIAVLVAASVGEYRAGDELWCETLGQGEFGRALNRDVLVPRPAGRFTFGRLINRDDEKLQILPLEAGGRQQVVANPPWLAVAATLVRSL